MVTINNIQSHNHYTFDSGTNTNAVQTGSFTYAANLIYGSYFRPRPNALNMTRLVPIKKNKWTMVQSLEIIHGA